MACLFPWAKFLSPCSIAGAEISGLLLSVNNPALEAGCWVEMIASGLLRSQFLVGNLYPMRELELGRATKANHSWPATLRSWRGSCADEDSP